MIRTEKGQWEIITVRAGAVEEKSKHFIPNDPGERTRAKKTEARKQALNDAVASRRMARLIHANFTAGDILVGLDYSDTALEVLKKRAELYQQRAGEETELEPEDFLRLSAEHELRLCIDRVRRLLGKEEIELKYIAVTSDMDGETGELVRIHHHLLIPRDCLEAFKTKWGKGRVVGKPLEQGLDYTQLAEYLCKQVRRVPDQKKYMPSRNLIKPTVSRRSAIGSAELRVPKGCTLLYRGAFEPGWTSQYIRYYRPMRS